MQINENTKIVGESVVLVPYKRQHVVKYHNWMEVCFVDRPSYCPIIRGAVVLWDVSKVS